MKNLILFLALLLVGCSGKGVSPTPEETTIETTDQASETSFIQEPDTTPPFEVSKAKSAGYNVWTITENRNKVAEIPCTLEICPNGLFDKPTTKQIKGEPVSARDATWSAALRALKNIVPKPDAKIIFDYSKINRQINNSKQCLFTGPIQIKNENGKYVEAEINLTVTHFWNDYREPGSWYVTGNIVF